MQPRGDAQVRAGRLEHTAGVVVQQQLAAHRYTGQREHRIDGPAGHHPRGLIGRKLRPGPPPQLLLLLGPLARDRRKIIEQPRGTATMTATMAHHKKLPQINLGWLFTEQRITNHLSTVFKNDRCVFVSEPAPHSVFQFGNGHAIAMSLVPNQLMVQLRQYWTIVRCSLPICHARALLKPPSNRCVTFLCLPLRSL